MNRSFEPAADVAAALARLRFVQLDPIRAPARAADLILRQRVPAHGDAHPRDLAAVFGRVQLRSDWGGISSATTRALAALHYRGKLHVVRREQGSKVYAAAAPWAEPLPPVARAGAVMLMLLDLYAPLPDASFRQLVRMITPSSVSVALRERTLTSRRPRIAGHARHQSKRRLPSAISFFQ